MQTATLEVITPAAARRVLEVSNSKNRPLQEKRARQIAEAITLGHWKVNGETIVFGKSGNVLTGQHRLRAVVISNIAIDTWVIRGVPDDVFVTLDQGSKKTSADILAIAGEKNTRILAACAKWVSVIENGGSAYWISKQTSPQDIQKIIALHPQIKDWANKLGGKNAKKRVLNSTSLAAIVLAGEKYGIHAIEPFFYGVVDGDNIQKTSPQYMLRDRLLSQDAQSRVDAQVIAAWTIKAVSAFAQNKKIGVLRWNSNESWPEI